VSPRYIKSPKSGGYRGLIEINLMFLNNSQLLEEP